MTTTATPSIQDLVRTHPEAYKPRAHPTLVKLGRATFLTFDGQGLTSGDTGPFQAAIAALYGVAYTLKFSAKARGRDFRVPPIEAIWSLPEGSVPATAPREAWHWKARIRVPDGLGARDVAAARALLAKRGKQGCFDEVRLERMNDGACVTMLHVGPYDAEQPALESLLAFAAEHGKTPRGWHHEVYLSDPQRTAPERLKTLLRLPVA